MSNPNEQRYIATGARGQMYCLRTDSGAYLQVQYPSGELGQVYELGQGRLGFENFERQFQPREVESFPAVVSLGGGSDE